MQRRFRPPRTRSFAAWAVLLLVAAASYWFGQAPTPPAVPLPEGTVEVSRVVDGDTLIINGARVRLIGVNAPESVRPEYPVEPFGPEASEFTKKFVAQGNIHLTFDKERYDRHGRMLAYVWSGDEMLNQALVEQGLARWEPNFYYSESKKRLFRLAQDQAKSARRGIWSEQAQSNPIAERENR